MRSLNVRMIWVAGLAVGLAGAFTFSSTAFASGGGCSPEWFEDIGLPSQYEANVRDFVAYDDGSGLKLHAAGDFEVDPLGRTGALRWNGGTWEALEIQGASNIASSRLLAVYQGQLIGAGTYWIDDEFYRVARWDAALHDWLPISDTASETAPFIFRKMVEFDGVLYLGGRYADSLGLNSGVLSRFDGASWSQPDLPVDPDFWGCLDLIVFDGDLYASFGTTGPLGEGAVYRLTNDGGTWEKIGGDVPASGGRLAVVQNELYIAGTPSFIQSFPNRVLRLVDGAWEPIPSTTDGSLFVEALIGADDGSGEALFIGGRFEDIGGVDDTFHIAKWDGAAWSPLGGGVSDGPDPTDEGRVNTLFAFNDGSGPALFVGGEFDRVFSNGATIFSAGVARWGCEPPAVDPFLSEVVADETAISSFGGTTRITITPQTPSGDLLDTGQAVSLLTDAGTLIGSVSDQGDGTYRQYLQGALGPAGATVSAVVNGVQLEQVASVAFVPVDPSLTTIELSIDETFVGGSAVATVTPVDDLGLLAGAGFIVQIATSLGELVGSVADNGDGTYSQSVLADAAGTASITASVNGMTLNTSASLTVLDPANVGSVIGYDENGNPVGFASIQAAMDAAPANSTIFISPGQYNETILIDGASGLTIEGLSAYEPVVVSGAVISESQEVSIRFLTIDPGGANHPRDAVEIRGGIRASSGVEIVGSIITGAAANGVFIGPGNEDVIISGSVVSNNGRYGIETRGAVSNLVVANSTIGDNGWSGVEIDRDVVATLMHNVISGNGHAFNNPNPNGYGIARARKNGDGTPEDVTLIQNVLENNNGRVQPGRSDSNIRNYDQVIDETDDQPPYTS